MSSKQSRNFITRALAVAGLFGAAVAGLGLDHQAAGETPPLQATVLPVEVRSIDVQDAYTLRRIFSGQVQARRQSELGFETAGRLSRVLVDEGTAVQAGQLLAELDTDRLEARHRELSAARAEAEAKLALAEVTLKRMRNIVDKGGVSRQGLDEARATQRAAKAALTLAEQQIATIDLELDKARLQAPFASTVIVRTGDEGRVLEAGQPILILLERAAPEIRIGVAGRTLEQLQPGQIYELTWRGQVITARLRVLLPVRAAVARTVDALFDPLDAPDLMLPGDLVTLTLDSRVEARGSWLPRSALGEGQRGLWSVYFAERLSDAAAEMVATHRIVRHTVDVIHQESDRVFVQGALDNEDRVVVTGMQRIVPGQMVRLAPAPVAVAEVRHD